MRPSPTTSSTSTTAAATAIASAAVSSTAGAAGRSTASAAVSLAKINSSKSSSSNSNSNRTTTALLALPAAAAVAAMAGASVIYSIPVPAPPQQQQQGATVQGSGAAQSIQQHLAHHHHLTGWQRYRNNFLSGCLALSTAFAVMHPLDTLKTRMQASAGTSSALTLKSLFSREMARVLGKGFMASVLGAGPQGGLRLSSYEYAKSHLLAHHSTSSSSSSTHSVGLELSPMAASAIAAVIGDLASSIVKVPREVVTARLQTSNNKAGASAVNVISSILKTEGPLGLFRGFWSTTARDAPFMIILFTTYESFKQYQHKFTFSLSSYYGSGNEDDDDDDIPSITTVKSTLFGGTSGALAGFLTTPFDVIKTKVMTSSANAPPLSMWEVARNLIEAQRVSGRPSIIGPYSAFFTGASARSIWWFGICSIFFPIYERSKETLRNLS